MQQIERAEDQAGREIRQAIASLQDDFPLTDILQERLEHLAQEISAQFPPVEFETAVVLPLVLSRQESEQVLRVTREALLNAQRYSQAARIALRLEKSGDELSVSVCDQGIGFTPGSQPQDGRPHFGLKIMQARAARLGGRLLIQSAPGSGTRVELRWAVAPERRMA
jgi:signal transduction histidine kinase